MKFPFFRQLEANDCGPTCIQMVTAYYGNKYSLRQLKDICNITRQGISAFDIVNCLKNIGFKSNAVSISKAEVSKMPLPAILYWRQEHYVVLYKIHKNRKGTFFYIADPSYSNIKLTDNEFDKSWINNDRGVAIVLQPSKEFFEKDVIKDIALNPFKRVFKLFFKIIKTHPKNISFTLILILISIVLNWAMPVILQKVIDDGVLKADVSMVWKLMFFQFFFFCGYTVSDSLSSILLTKINFIESIKYLGEYLYKLVRLPVKFFDTRLNTDLIQRMDDQEKVHSFLTYRFIDLFFSVLNLCVFGSILLFYSTQSFLIFLFLSIISIIWSILFLKKRKRLDYDQFYISSQNKNNIYEMINGMSEIKINNAQIVRISRWEKIQKQMNEIKLKSLYLNYYQLIGSSFVNRFRDIVITCLCAFLVISQNMTLGVMMTISYILGQLSAPINQLIQLTQAFQDTSNSLDRLDDIQYRKDEDKEAKICPPDWIKQGIKLSNIYFKYIDNAKSYVIENLSLNIPKGKITAIVGVSGSGKTTLIKLLLSFYYPQKGDIYLDGIKLNKINSDLWRQMCGVVMQDGIIFSGSIAENIALGDEIPDMERVKFASQLACMDSFVAELPMQYATKIGKIGVELSGGQKQRILIARAIYKNPQFIILDEATSSLDANNELCILNNLNLFFESKTVVVVAHRLSTVKNADNIIVMDHGKIVEEGTHTALSEMKGVYYNLVKNQLELGY